MNIHILIAEMLERRAAIRRRDSRRDHNTDHDQWRGPAEATRDTLETHKLIFRLR